MTVTEAKAALERGRAVVLVRPPALDRMGELWELLRGECGASSTGEVATVILTSDADAAAEWAAAAPADLRCHAVTGLSRSAELLKGHTISLLAGAAPDVAALAERAALKLERVARVVVAWPEPLVCGPGAAALDTVLAEARAAQRIVLSWNPAGLGDFLERHARRALVLGTPPVTDTGAPLPPAARVRYAVVAPFRRAIAARDALDAVGATRPFVWDGGPLAPPAGGPGSPPDAVLCTRLPTRDELIALAGLGPTTVLVTPLQLPYLRSIAVVTPLALPSSADRARDRAAALQDRVASRLAAGHVDAELTLLDPLFQRFDPAEVAAALLAVLAPEGGGAAERAPAAPLPPAPATLFVNVGKRDRVAAKDLVGALIREAGLAKQEIGHIQVRETFSLVEVAASVAAQAVRGLTGVTIRGRRVLARFERER